MDTPTGTRLLEADRMRRGNILSVCQGNYLLWAAWNTDGCNSSFLYIIEAPSFDLSHRAD
eukprot:c4608_g1_i1 orf=98-277(-)